MVYIYKFNNLSYSYNIIEFIGIIKSVKIFKYIYLIIKSVCVECHVVSDFERMWPVNIPFKISNSSFGILIKPSFEHIHIIDFAVCEIPLRISELRTLYLYVHNIIIYQWKNKPWSI